MNQLETLYKRTTRGAIQQWTVGWEDRDAYGGTNEAYVIAIQGQVGGKLQEYKQTVIGKNIGKSNETTPVQQAEMDARSDWKRKKDGGYKTREDVGIYVVGEIGDSESYCRVTGQSTSFKLKAALDLMLPKFNTDANGNVKPMLAHSVKDDFSNVKFPCLVQPKLDGVRALLIKNDQGELEFLSRSGKQYTTLKHIINSVPQEAIDNWIPLDGEIYSDDLTFQEILQAVKKQYPNSLKLRYRVYDVVTTSSQIIRDLQTEDAVTRCLSDYISHVETMEKHDSADIIAVHDTWVREGYEGAMIRLMDGIYQQGQRSRSLLKYKKFDEEEFEFAGWTYGQREEDLIAICKTKEGKQFRAKMEGSKELKARLEYEHTFVGGQLTVKFFGWTTDGLPRFPIGKGFRDGE